MVDSGPSPPTRPTVLMVRRLWYRALLSLHEHLRHRATRPEVLSSSHDDHPLPARPRHRHFTRVLGPTSRPVHAAAAHHSARAMAIAATTRLCCRRDPAEQAL